MIYTTGVAWWHDCASSTCASGNGGRNWPSHQNPSSNWPLLHAQPDERPLQLDGCGEAHGGCLWPCVEFRGRWPTASPFKILRMWTMGRKVVLLSGGGQLHCLAFPRVATACKGSGNCSRPTASSSLHRHARLGQFSSREHQAPLLSKNSISSAKQKCTRKMRGKLHVIAKVMWVFVFPICGLPEFNVVL